MHQMSRNGEEENYRKAREGSPKPRRYMGARKSIIPFNPPYYHRQVDESSAEEEDKDYIHRHVLQGKLERAF